MQDGRNDGPNSGAGKMTGRGRKASNREPPTAAFRRVLSFFPVQLFDPSFSSPVRQRCGTHTRSMESSQQSHACVDWTAMLQSSTVRNSDGGTDRGAHHPSATDTVERLTSDRQTEADSSHHSWKPWQTDCSWQTLKTERNSRPPILFDMSLSGPKSQPRQDFSSSSTRMHQIR